MLNVCVKINLYNREYNTLLRVITLCFALILFNVIAAQENSDYTIPAPPDDVNPNLVIGQVGDDTLTLGDFAARLRYERLRYYNILVTLAEQLGENALDLQDPTNQYAGSIQDLLFALANDDQFAALIYDTIMIEMLYRQEAEARGITIEDCELEFVWASRLSIQDPAFDCEALSEEFLTLKEAYYADAQTFAGLTRDDVDQMILVVAQYQAVVDALREETPVDLVPARRTRH
jgi:hypothetical protein